MPSGTKTTWREGEGRLGEGRERILKGQILKDFSGLQDPLLLEGVPHFTFHFSVSLINFVKLSHFSCLLTFYLVEEKNLKRTCTSRWEQNH
jgi:hypothetical protein